MNLEYPVSAGLYERFVPPLCPRNGCPSRQEGAGFTFQRKGRFRRKCDDRVVQRFRCRACRHYFSTQTFRLDYRLHRPTLHLGLFDTFVSKVTQRQAARTHGCTRKSVVHRLDLLSSHARAFHALVLERVRRLGGLRGDFQLDELETFETCRLLSPLSVPMLIELHKLFVLHGEVATLPPRGRLPPRLEARKIAREKEEGPRRSGSRAAVVSCFRVLAEVRDPDCALTISSDYKSSYPTALKEVMPGTYCHVRHSSKTRRDRANPLFPINLMLAMMRDGLSRLVRRSWGVSKMRQWLEKHLWVWIAYRNYIRPLTNRSPHITSGQALGVVHRRFTKATFFEWRCVFAA